MSVELHEKNEKYLKKCLLFIYRYKPINVFHLHKIKIDNIPLILIMVAFLRKQEMEEKHEEIKKSSPRRPVFGADERCGDRLQRTIEGNLHIR